MPEEYDFTDVNVEDAQGLQTLEDNTEAKLRIIEAERNTEKCYVLLRLEVVGEELAKEIRQFLFYPKTKRWAKAQGLDENAADGVRKQVNKEKMLKTFFQAFDIPQNGVPPSEMVGREGFVILKLEESDEYGKQNSIKKVVSPAD